MRVIEHLSSNISSLINSTTKTIMQEAKSTIQAGKAILGIEFGSTRIKAVLLDVGAKTAVAILKSVPDFVDAVGPQPVD